MNAGFIKFLRSESTEELLRYPASFTLLAQIAFRARREVPKINPYNMQLGEAMIGDFATIGLTRQQFRQAVARLEKSGFITTRPTNKGTIAKLCNTDVYNINTATQQPPTQPTGEPANNHQPNQQRNQQGNQPTTTNKNDKKERREEGGRDTPSPTSFRKDSSVDTPRLYWPDEAPVFLFANFSDFVTSKKYGHIDKGFYLREIQGKAELLNEQRDDDGWRRFIFKFLGNEVRDGKLVAADTVVKVKVIPPMPADPRDLWGFNDTPEQRAHRLANNL